MDLVIARESLLRALQMVQNVVETRQTLPILSNVLLEAATDELVITATDLEVGARVSAPAKVASQGAITLSARKLVEIVREQRGDSVAIKRSGEAGGVQLRCGGAVYRMVGLEPGDYPPVVPAEARGWLGIEARVLKDALSQTVFAVSHDDSRPALNGVLVELQPGEFRVVATDGHRLAVATRQVGQGLSGQSGIVPRKAVAEALRVLGGSEEVHVALTENQFILRMANFMLTSRLIEGQFPKYEGVIPKGHPGQLVINRTAFSEALRRVSVMADDNNKPVKLSISGGGIRLSAVSQELGEAEELVETGYEGPDVTIGFNARYLLDALGAASGEDTILEFKDGTSPGTLRSSQDENYCCVIMPMRI